MAKLPRLKGAVLGRGPVPKRAPRPAPRMRTGIVTKGTR